MNFLEWELLSNKKRRHLEMPPSKIYDSRGSIHLEKIVCNLGYYATTLPHAAG
jgi:hypothetical protein